MAHHYTPQEIENEMTEPNRSRDVCDFETISKVLEMCWCESKCLVGKGAYGCVYKGKWKENPKARKTIDVAGKVPIGGPYYVEYEIASLKKANGHRNVLKFYDQVKYGPSR